MLASEIITEARHILSDANSIRWSDARLLTLLNDCLLTIGVNTNLFSDHLYLRLIANVVQYDISDMAVLIQRVEYNEEPIDMVTMAEMDEQSLSWKSDTGTEPEAIVYDKKSRGEFRLYPILTELSTSNISTNSDYGVITALSYEDLELDIEEDYGDIDAADLSEFIVIHYVRKMAKITAVTDELDGLVDEYFTTIIAHYIAGHCYKENQDAKNIALGDAQIALYEAKLGGLVANKVRNSVKKTRTPTYRPIG